MLELLWLSVAQIIDALIAEVGKDRVGVRLSPFGGASQVYPWEGRNAKR